MTNPGSMSYKMALRQEIFVKRTLRNLPDAIDAEPFDFAGVQETVGSIPADVERFTKFVNRYQIQSVLIHDLLLPSVCKKYMYYVDV